MTTTFSPRLLAALLCWLSINEFCIVFIARRRWLKHWTVNFGNGWCVQASSAHDQLWITSIKTLQLKIPARTMLPHPPSSHRSTLHFLKERREGIERSQFNPARIYEHQLGRLSTTLFSCQPRWKTSWRPLIGTPAPLINTSPPRRMIHGAVSDPLRLAPLQRRYNKLWVESSHISWLQHSLLVLAIKRRHGATSRCVFAPGDFMEAEEGPGCLRKMCSLKALLIFFLLVAVTGVCVAFIVLYFTTKPASSEPVEGKSPI